MDIISKFHSLPLCCYQQHYLKEIKGVITWVESNIYYLYQISSWLFLLQVEATRLRIWSNTQHPHAWP